MDETFNAERVTRLFNYALRSSNADVIRTALKAARIAGEPVGMLIAAAAADARVERWDVSYLLGTVARYGESALLADFRDGQDEKLRKAATSAAVTIERWKEKGVFLQHELGPFEATDRVVARLILGERLGPDDLAPALDLLAHPNGGISRMARAAVAAALAIDLLLPALENAGVGALEVCSLLGESRDPRAVPLIAKLVRQGGGDGRSENELKNAAAAALERIADEPSVIVLVSLLGGRDSAVRGALSRIGKPAAPVLLRVYRDDPRWRRAESALLAEVLGTDALPALLEALQDRYRTVREDAERGLMHLGGAAVKPLLSLAEAADPLTRRDAVRVLGNIGDKRAFGRLAEMARGDDPRDRLAAIEALGGLSDEDSLSLLAEMARAPERETRRAAVIALGRRRAVRAVKLLAAASADPERAVRADAVNSLARFLEDEGVNETGAALEALIAFVKDEDAEVAAMAADALVRAGEAASTRIQNAALTAEGEHASRLKDALDRIRRAAERRRKQDVWMPASAMMSEELASEYDDERARRHAPRPQVRDSVHFTVTAPPVVAPGETFVLDVWAHTDGQRGRVLSRARQARRGRDVYAPSKGPLPVERGNEVTVRLSLPALGVEDEADTLYWEGEISNCTFGVGVPKDAPRGTIVGKASLSVGGLSLARLHFELEIGGHAAEADDLVTREERIKSAFASYASEERELVLAGVQGLLKARPDLDVFLDVVALRVGEKWAERLLEEVPKRDVLYLFWSRAASRSEWVEKEWRAAYEAKGVDGVDPFPLEPQGVAPAPPDELKDLHFNDPLLAFTRPAK